MQPMVHYIPLKKDFSNFDEVVRLFSDASVRKRITDQCYNDLIASGRYSYGKFIEQFDEDLLRSGFLAEAGQGRDVSTSLVLWWDMPVRELPRHIAYRVAWWLLRPGRPGYVRRLFTEDRLFLPLRRLFRKYMFLAEASSERR